MASFDGRSRGLSPANKQGVTPKSSWGSECKVKGFLQWFMQYGLVAAIVVWAGAIGLMAYHLDDSPWRWAFATLAVGGLATVWGISRIRRYVDAMSQTAQPEKKS